MASYQNDISNIDFSLQIAKRVGLEKAEEGLNFAISPVSIHAILSLIAAGSTGKTLEQLLFFLKSKTINDLNETTLGLVKLMSPHGNGGPVLSFASSIWVDKCFDLKPHFREIVCCAHGAQAKDVDFKTKADQVTEEVNSWVENATKGLIKNALERGIIGSSTILILANALYFKGIWSRRFDRSKTRDRMFYLLNGDTVQVPFMSSKGRQLFRSFDDYKVLKLPYENGLDSRNFSMYFFLPKEKNGLKNLIQKANSSVGFFSQDFELRNTTLEDFAVPEFKIFFDFEASKTLQELGLVLPFMNCGELSEMVHSAQGLFVSNIIHKSCVEVNEEGTEAAAAGFALAVGFSANPPPKPTFVADHPFMFIIREDTSKMVLFVGAVLNPSM